MGAMGAALLAIGYPASLVVIARFVPVVRQRRWRWLALHHAGVLAIIGGWVLRGNRPAAAVNSGWLVVSSVLYAAGGRQSGPRRSESS